MGFEAQIEALDPMTDKLLDALSDLMEKRTLMRSPRQRSCSALG